MARVFFHQEEYRNDRSLEQMRTIRERLETRQQAGHDMRNHERGVS